MASYAVIAALPRELGLLTRGLKAEPLLRRSGIALYRRQNVAFVAAGMGAARVSLAFQTVMQGQQNVDTIVSIGLAGACGAETEPGAVLEASLVIDTRTGERFSTSYPGTGLNLLATTETIASVQEKARLHAAYGAVMVDMEAAVLARLSQAHHLAFRSIKGISDAHDFELASLSRFTGKHGQFRTGAFAAHTALRPHLWRPAVTLGRTSQRALQQLSQTINSLITETV